MSPGGDRDLDFETLGLRTLSRHALFSLDEATRRGPDGRERPYLLVRAPDWANVIATGPDSAGRTCFLMVRQYRHGLGRAVWEFPGGMVDPGEDARDAAARELTEETGWTAARLTLLGATNPNPSFMTNTVHTFAAEGLTRTGSQHLDEGEHVAVGWRPVDEVLAQVGSGEYDHGIMLMALWWWTRARPSG